MGNNRLRNGFLTGTDRVSGWPAIKVRLEKVKKMSGNVSQSLNRFFTESALRPIQSISRDVRLFVCALSLCIFVGHTLKTTLPKGLESSGRKA